MYCTGLYIFTLVSRWVAEFLPILTKGKRFLSSFSRHQQFYSLFQKSTHTWGSPKLNILLFSDETTSTFRSSGGKWDSKREGQAIYDGIKGDTPEMGNNRRAIARRNELDGRKGLVPQVLSNWWRNGPSPPLFVIGDEGSHRTWQIQCDWHHIS